MPKTRSAKSRDDGDSDKLGRALATEEELRRQQEINRISYKQKQMREQRYAHINSIKINSQWRKIKRMTKVEDLKRNIEILAQNHERDVDREDAVIQMLDRDLDDSEDQYQMALRSHEEAVEKLLDLQESRKTQKQKTFEKQVHDMKAKFDQEQNEILKRHEERANEMKKLLAVMENEQADSEADCKQEFEAQREEIKNKNSEEYNVLKIQLEGAAEDLEHQFDQAHKTYLNGTEHRTRAFEKLTKNDSGAAHIIEMKMKKLQKLQDGLSFWRQKISSTMSNWEERNKLLKHEKEMMSKHYRALKASMENFRSTQDQKLKHLSTNARKAENEIINKLSVGESILNLWRICQSYETEKEHLFQFFLSNTDTNEDASTTHNEHSNENAVDDCEQKGVRYDDSLFKTKLYNEARASITSTAMGPDGNEVEEWNYLQNFFKKFNDVLISKHTIQKEKERLSEENTRLQSLLKKYLDGISVNSQVLDDPANTLMVINNRLQNKIVNKMK